MRPVRVDSGGRCGVDVEGPGTDLDPGDAREALQMLPVVRGRVLRDLTEAGAPLSRRIDGVLLTDEGRSQGSVVGVHQQHTGRGVRPPAAQTTSMLGPSDSDEEAASVSVVGGGVWP